MDHHLNTIHPYPDEDILCMRCTHEHRRTGVSRDHRRSFSVLVEAREGRGTTSFLVLHGSRRTLSCPASSMKETNGSNSVRGCCFLEQDPMGSRKRCGLCEPQTERDPSWCRYTSTTNTCDDGWIKTHFIAFDPSLFHQRTKVRTNSSLHQTCTRSKRYAKLTCGVHVLSFSHHLCPLSDRSK